MAVATTTAPKSAARFNVTGGGHAPSAAE
jgi:hypothetical protein